MTQFDFAVSATLAVTILFAAAAIWLASVGPEAPTSRRQVAERLAQIAVLGAVALFALLKRDS
ncbi:hypothetical protein [Neoaquamicrobium sediminum]|mgnify:CR=1 FL=1|uniref:HIG1 domain-containing protein n=1 Tax=Neoaquamicrobium sediminum TaxID=1849104 RepID=A0ABV3X017_9HYPH